MERLGSGQIVLTVDALSWQQKVSNTIESYQAPN